MLKEVYQGKVQYLQVLDENGVLDASLFPKDLTDQKIIEMYKWMCFARAMDAKTLSLQRQGRAVTYAPLIGEEATQIGSAMAMRPSDLFVPSFRQHGVFLVRGFPLELFFIYWRGFEEGGKMPEGFDGFEVIVPVATQIPHAAGIAFAQKYKKKDAAVIGYVGDGGTSEGDFYEGLNFAGVMKLPLVTIIENNQWAISIPRKNQTASETLAQKGLGVGMTSIQVDGNDVIAVYKAVSEAIANSKNGPTLIECVTYRMSMHTTADDPTKYRPNEEVEFWAKRDPILRVRRYLDSKKLWSDDLQKQMEEEQLKKLDEAVEKAEEFKPDPKSIFEHIYAKMPAVLKDEYDEAIQNDFWQGTL